MNFVLKITNPEGGTYTYDENGLTLFVTKYQAACAVLRALDEIHPSMLNEEAHSIRRDLYAEPTGTEVSILSGYKFKIERSVDEEDQRIIRKYDGP